MRKLLRFSAWALAVTLVMVLAAFFSLKIYFTPERIKALVLEYAGKNLKREVTLETASVNLRGFSITDLKVAETGGFKKGEFLSAKDFSMRPDFKALLGKELKIKSIRASGVAVRIMQGKKDTYNFSDLIASPGAGPAKKPAAGPPAKPIELGISDINVTNTRVVYVNADRSMTVTFSDLNLKATDLTSGELFPVEADFTLGVKSSYLTGEFPVYIKGLTALGGWNPEKGRAVIEKATIKAGKIFCKIEGGLENLVEPDAKISLAVKPFSSTELKPYFPQTPARILLPALETNVVFKLTSRDVTFKKLDFTAGPASGKMKGRISWTPELDYDLALDIKAQTPEMDTTEIARKLRSTPKHIKLPLTEITARLTVSPKKIKVLAAELSAKSLKASGAVDISMGRGFTATGKIKAAAGNLRDFAAIFPPMKEYDLSGSVSGSASFAMDKDLNWKGSAEFSGLSAKFMETRFSELNGSAELSNNHISAQARGKLDGAQVKADLVAKNYMTHPQVTLNADLAALKLPAIPAQQPAAKNGGSSAPAKKSAAAASAMVFDIHGKTRIGSIAHPNLAAGETTVTYDLKNVSENLKLLSGSAAFTVSGGKFDGLIELAKTYKTAKVALYPMLMLNKASKLAKGMKLPDFNTVKFTRMEGDYLFQDGLMKLQRSRLDADIADSDTSGLINLVSEELDLRISTTLKKASGIALSAPVAMTVKGTFDNPSVKPDVKSIMEQPAIKKNVEKLLKNFLK